MKAGHSKTISLVLGGGGARGMAHIGVIRWLTENGYTIRSIAGSSIGALIGGIYAAGKLDVYEKWVSALDRVDVIRLLDPTFGRSGFFKGERVINLLKNLIGDMKIEDLPLAFTAVATDLATGNEVWLRRGPLFDAIRASIAIPLFFTPFEHGDRLLLDGGLVNPVPIAPTLNDATDFIIAVSLVGSAEPFEKAPGKIKLLNESPYKKQIRAFIDSLHLPSDDETSPPGMVEIAIKSMDTMQRIIARSKLAAYAPNVLIEVPHNICQFHEFWRAKELIDFGYARMAHTMSTHPALAHFSRRVDD